MVPVEVLAEPTQEEHLSLQQSPTMDLLLVSFYTTTPGHSQHPSVSSDPAQADKTAAGPGGHTELPVVLECVRENAHYQETGKEKLAQEGS